MDGEVICARLTESVDGLFRLADHQVRVEGKRGDGAQVGDGFLAERDLRDEAPVHDVKVDEVTPDFLHEPHCIRQGPEVRGKD